VQLKGVTTVVFDLCVRLLEWLARVFGTTYEAVNVWIFCVIWPLFTVGLIVAIIRQRKKIDYFQHKSIP